MNPNRCSLRYPFGCTFKMYRTPFATGPVYGTPIPPIARPNRVWDKQIVWPRDKKQEGSHTWSRWKDIFTNKGPDMWVSQRGGNGVHRPVWSGWNQEGRDNLGYFYRNDNHRDDLRWAYRPEWQRYDFNKRRYRMPDDQTWSDVKWSRKGRRPLYTRGPHGDERLSAEYDHHTSENPFAWHYDTPFWDWHYDHYHRPLFNIR